MFVSVILPAFMEAANLRLLIPRICNELSELQHEVIVVDDNSPDNTVEVFESLKEANFNVRLIIRTKNKGFANSIREGIDQSRGDLIVVMDSDGNHDPGYLSFMCMATQFYPCVVASRFQYGGGMESKTRQVLSWIFNIFVRASTGGYVTDSLYGFFAIRKDVLLSLNFEKIFWGYGDYCIRLLFYLQKRKISILQFPAKNGPRENGLGNSRLFRVFMRYFTECIMLVFRERFFNGREN